MFQRRSKKTQKKLSISLGLASMGSAIFLFSLFDGYRNAERAKTLGWFYPFVYGVGIITAIVWIYFLICFKKGKKRSSKSVLEVD